MITRVLLLLVVMLCVAPDAGAHEIRPVWLQISETTTPGTYDIIWKQPVVEGRKLKIEPIFPDTCKSVNKGPGEVTSTAIILRSQLSCDTPGLEGQEVRIAGLERTMIDVFVDFVGADGARRSLVVKPRDPVFTLGSGVSGGDDFGLSSYFRLGVEHLLTGFDHIVFVIGLVLLVRTPVKLIKVVTSFTVAHSLTLGLSTFGVVSVSQGVIEAVIALSILFLAVEIVKADQIDQSLIVRHPWSITFVFGLLHGFGFAGALAEIGLPQGAASLALLLFNLGVELGQLIIVSLVLAGLYCIRFVSLPWVTAARPVPAYLIGTLATYWFLERAFGLF